MDVVLLALLRCPYCGGTPNPATSDELVDESEPGCCWHPILRKGAIGSAGGSADEVIVLPCAR
jgi:hypothetical protein